jgi:hypothetical protein
MKNEPIMRGRWLLLRSQKVPSQLIEQKICELKLDGLFWVVVTPLGLEYFIEVFAGGKKWGLTPRFRATFWDWLRTFGKLRRGSHYVGSACPQKFQQDFIQS